MENKWKNTGIVNRSWQLTNGYVNWPMQCYWQRRKKKTHLIFQRESKVIFMATFIKWSGLIFENEPIVYISLSKDGLDRLNFDIRGPQSLSISLLLSGSGWKNLLAFPFELYESSKAWNLIHSLTPSLSRSECQFSKQVIVRISCWLFVSVWSYIETIFLM